MKIPYLTLADTKIKVFEVTIDIKDCHCTRLHICHFLVEM